MSARLWNLLAVLAVIYLGVMALGGEQMQQAQFVKFEAKGLLAEDPAVVKSVVLRRGEASVTLLRGAQGWTREGVVVAATLQPRVDLAVKFLHTAGPVRRIEAAAMGDTTQGELGFDASALTVTAQLDTTRVFTFTLGARTPEGSLQYLRVAGEEAVYLMSGFVGEEWEALWAGLQ